MGDQTRAALRLLWRSMIAQLYGKVHALLLGPHASGNLSVVLQRGQFEHLLDFLGVWHTGCKTYFDHCMTGSFNVFPAFACFCCRSSVQVCLQEKEQVLNKNIKLGVLLVLLVTASVGNKIVRGHGDNSSARD